MPSPPNMHRNFHYKINRKDNFYQLVNNLHSCFCFCDSVTISIATNSRVFEQTLTAKIDVQTAGSSPFLSLNLDEKQQTSDNFPSSVGPPELRELRNA
jgi:hypothetical protein